MNEVSNPLLDEAMRHLTLGHAEYQHGRLAQCARALRRATRIATAIGPEGTELEDECRFWLGAALHGEGNLVEALAAWTPVVERVAVASMTRQRYMALTRYLLVAVDMPLPLARIETAFDEVQARLRELGGGYEDLRSRMLLARTRLALHRGEWADTLELGLEALARRRREHPAYSFCCHYRPLVQACFRMGDLDQVRRYLMEWDLAPTDYSGTKRLLMTAARVRCKVERGDIAGATSTATGIDREIRLCEESSFAVEAGAVFVRMCIAAGVAARGRAILSHLLGSRHAALGEVRFDLRLLQLDHALAVRDAPRPDGSIAESRVSRVLAGARREAARLDELLCCDRHSREVERRIRSQPGRIHSP